MQSGKICGGLGLRACKAAQDELRLYTLEEMEQAIRRWLARPQADQSRHVR